MKQSLTVAALVACLASPVLAHTGGHDTSGFLHGVQHPLLGMDHLLAMLAVGLWSGFVLPTRFWLGAATFLTAMLAGAGLAWGGVAYPMVEGMIMLSVLAFGLLTAFSRRGQPDWMTGASLATIAVFASAHGYAHATEATGSALAYLSGFLLSTAVLHLAGIGIARSVASRPVAQQALGAGIALSGLWLMAG